MAKQKKEDSEQEDFEPIDIELSDDDCENIVNYITKERVIATLWLRIVEPYVEGSVGNTKQIVKPPEAMKALEMISKLKGFDKASAEELPDEIELKL